MGRTRFVYLFSAERRSPTYSPHLNLIERLWLKAKYEWLKPHHYESFETLTTAVEEILNQVGSKLTLTKLNTLQNSKRRLNLNDYLNSILPFEIIQNSEEIFINLVY